LPRYTVIRVRGLHRYMLNTGYDKRLKALKRLLEGVEPLLNGFLYQRNSIAFLLPTGEFIVLSNNLDKKTHMDLLVELDKATPYGVDMASVITPNPLTAIQAAARYLRNSHFFFEEELDSRDGEYWVLAMTPLNPDIRGLDAYIAYSSLTSSVARLLERYGGIIVEQAGNTMVAIGGRELGEATDELVHLVHAGIGVSRQGLNAYRNAIRALQQVINGVVEGKVGIIMDSEHE